MPDKPKLWVCSLQYSPIYKSHCCALGKQAELEGYDVRYLFSHAYAWMLPADIKEKTWFFGNSTGIISSIGDGLSYKIRSKLKNLVKNDPPDFIYFYNFHPLLNYFIASLAKKYGCTFIQHMQEPYVEDKTAYKGLKRFWLSGFEYLQGRLLDKSDIAIVSSKKSMELFKKRYTNFHGKLLIIPLMYEDYAEQLIPYPIRQFIIFIGPPVPAKGSEIFLKIVQYCQMKNPEYQFLLITREKITDPRYHQYNNLKIAYNNKISDQMMSEYQKSSRMVMTPYTVATQSSVVLTSYQYGTPALSSNVGGLPEFIEHKKTGYLVDVQAPVAEWVKGMDFICDHIDEMSVRCRKYYQDNFSEHNWPRYFGVLFDD
jgi:glycosyltransferase involved in cell wall biosynthesis